MSETFADIDPQERQYDFSLALNRATPKPFVTFGLIGLNVLMFIVMFFFGVSPIGPTPKEVLPWGANLGPLTTSGEWWRLLTACFLHFGVIHLGMNMIILYQVGIFTEKLFGSLRFLVLYLTAGGFGNIAGLYAHPQVVSAGASGAVFGVYGGLLGFLLLERGVVPVESALGIAKSAGIFLLINLVYGLSSPQTDLVAHIAGLLVGFAAGCVLARPLAPAAEHSHPLRALAVAAGAALLGVAAVSGVTKTSRSEGDWDRLIAQNPSVTVGTNDQVVYRGAATKDDAQNLAKTLQKVGLMQRPGILVVLNKDAGGTSITIPVKDVTTNASLAAASGSPGGSANPIRKLPPWQDPAFLLMMKRLGPQFAFAVGGPPLAIRLVNGKGEPENEIQIHTGEITFGQRDRVSYAGTATAKDAKALGWALRDCGFFKDRGVLVYLSKNGGPPEVSFVLGNEAWNNPRIVVGFQEIGRKIAASLGGPPLKENLVDTNLQVRKQLSID